MDPNKMSLALTWVECVAWVAAVAGLLIVAMVGLYVWKKRRGSQGWRIKVPAGVQRGMVFGVWVVCKKLPWKPILIWGPWVAMILGTGAYLFENWRGERAWKKAEKVLSAKGVNLDLTDYEPRPIPAEDDFMRHPAVMAELALGSGSPLPSFRGSSFPGLASRVALNNPDLGQHLDVRKWAISPSDYASSREAAEFFLGHLASERARLDGVVEATRRPACYQPWIRWDDNPLTWELQPHARELITWLRLLRYRSMLSLAAGHLDAAVEDFRACLKLGVYLGRMGETAQYYGGFGRIAHLDAILWELLTHPRVDPEKLSFVERELSSVDPQESAIEALRFQQVYFAALIDAFERYRGEAYEYGNASFIDLSFSWTPTWVDEFGYWLDEVAHRVAPRGWFAGWKADLVRFYNRQIDQAERLRGLPRDADLSILEERNQLGSGYGGELLGGFFMMAESRVDSVHYNQVRLDLMRIGLALERFRKRRGSYPKRLEELVPEYLGALPHDPMGEGGYRYRVKEDGTPLIWSLGENGVDDGGVPAARRFVAEKLDWVWQYTATKGQTEKMWKFGEKP